MRAYKILKEKDQKTVNEFLDQRSKDQDHNRKTAYEAFGYTKDEIDLFGNERNGLHMSDCFKPKKDTIAIDTKLFILKKDGYYYPRKNKVGRGIIEKLATQKYYGWYDKIGDMLNVCLTIYNTKFVTPAFRVLKDKTLILSCDSRIELDRERFEEVTITYVNDNL